MKKTLTLVLAGVLLGSTITFAATTIFPDVPSDAWYSDSVNSLVEKGIIEGYPDGTYGPENSVNRAELAVIIDKTIQYLQTGEVVTSGQVPVSFSREGLLTEAEKTELKENFAYPYVECKDSMNPTNPIAAVLIEVPQNVGEQFIYTAINQEFGLSQGYYGVRGEPIPVFECSTGVLG